MVFAWIFHQTTGYSVYLSQENHAEGRWIGKACPSFGVVEGTRVQHSEFARLENNQHAISGERLTQRKVKLKKDMSNRRTVLDFTINCPKSFSIALMVGQRADILLMHQRATLKVVTAMEQMAMCSHSSGYKRSMETTSNFCGALYSHFTNRSGEPGLHSHLAIPNATVSKDGKIYALDPTQWINKCSYFTAIYRDALASEAIKAGLDISIDKFGAPQLRMIEDLNPKFSGRSSDIAEVIEAAEEFVGSLLSDAEKKRLVMQTRGVDLVGFREQWQQERSKLEVDHLNAPDTPKARKKLLARFEAIVRNCSDQSAPEFKTFDGREWRGILDPEELGRLMSLAEEKPTSPPRCMTVENAVDWAIKHAFARESVVKTWRLATHALRFAQGANLDLDKLNQCIEEHPNLILRGNEAATPEHYSRECDTIKWVEEGKGKGAKLGKVKNPKLTEHQLKAVNELLGCQDKFFCLLGKAGSGKSFSLDELIRANEAQGYRVIAVAPSHKSKDVLTHHDTSTLQMFLKKPGDLRAMDLLVIDEASLADTEQIFKVIKLATQNRWRVCFSGDVYQHHSVGAGDALRILLERTKIRREWLSDILRQKPDVLSGRYLRAVKQFSVGKTSEGFATLDRAGAIEVALGQDRIEKMADAYMVERKAGRSVSIVNPSNRECDLVNMAVRNRLKAIGAIGEEREFQVHRSLGWSLAEREECRNLRPGLILEITQGRNKGEVFEVRSIDPNKNCAYAVNKNGLRAKFDKSSAESWAVCERRSIPIGPGDDLITNAAMRTKKGIVQNGVKFTVGSVDNGEIRTTEGKLIETRNLSFAAATTSHKSQGETVDSVIFGTDRASVNWISRQLSYVAISRGRSMVKVFCESREDLCTVEGRKGIRTGATELIKFVLDMSRLKKPRQVQHQIDRAA